MVFMNKKALFFAMILGGLSGFLWAGQPQAVLQSLKGKVEVRAAGEKVWVRATEGQVLPLSATLSTGFDSSVVVIIDKTTIQVKPLTRMAIDKLAMDGDTVKTSTFLRVGSVSASVKSAEGVKQDFKVQSPYSTASVRGTEFDFDGISLSVREGMVAFVLGRAARDIVDPTMGSTDDFAGAPDVRADEANAVPVPAGRDARVVLDFRGEGPRTGGSSDRDSLESAAGAAGGKTDSVLKPTGSTKGNVKLTIQFVD